jgi:hypothetical protein
MLFELLLVALVIVILVVIFTRSPSTKDGFIPVQPNTFETIFKTLDYGSLKTKYTFRAYEEFFRRFRGKKPVILEIGVRGGGGIEMFYKYFEDRCEVYGVDIENRVKRIQKKYPQTTIFIGDQADPEFMKHVATSIGKPIDIVLDDGGHFMHQQIRSFETMFPFLSDGGVYVIEDAGTSYNNDFNNHTTPTLVEYMKRMLDNVVRDGLTDPWKSVKSIQFYKDMVAVQKDKDIPFVFVYKDKNQYKDNITDVYRDAPDPFRTNY